MNHWLPRLIAASAIALTLAGNATAQAQLAAKAGNTPRPSTLLEFESITSTVTGR